MYLMTERLLVVFCLVVSMRYLVSFFSFGTALVTGLVMALPHVDIF